jgi:hypothetical protein
VVRVIASVTSIAVGRAGIACALRHILVVVVVWRFGLVNLGAALTNFRLDNLVLGKV